jgi:hypothetical protein
MGIAMVKRTANANVWHEPWFRKLPAPYKLAWKFLVDQADNCGLLYVDTELWMFMLGMKDSMNWEKFFEAVGDKIHRLSSTELWIPQVINDGCGAITWDCRPHRPIIDFLKRHGLTTDQRIHVLKLEPTESDMVKVTRRKGIDTLSIPFQYPIDTLSRSASAPTAKPKKEVKRFTKPTVEEIAEYCAAQGNGLDAQQIFDHYEACGWVQGRGRKPIKDWKAAVRTWERSRKTFDVIPFQGGKTETDPDAEAERIRRSVAEDMKKRSQPEVHGPGMLEGLKRGG